MTQKTSSKEEEAWAEAIITWATCRIYSRCSWEVEWEAWAACQEEDLVEVVDEEEAILSLALADTLDKAATSPSDSDETIVISI